MSRLFLLFGNDYMGILTNVCNFSFASVFDTWSCLGMLIAGAADCIGPGPGDN